MKTSEKIKKYRKQANLSQEDLASKIYVSRTLITKYESGTVFPTDENIKKLAEVFGIETDDLLSDDEKSQVVEKSHNSRNRYWLILSICAASISVVLLLLSVIPFYEYSSYDYSAVSYPDNPTPIHVTGYVSIITTTLKVGNPISIINVSLLVISLILFTLNFVNMNIKAKNIVRIISMILFVSSLVLFIASFAAMVSIVSAPGLQMNIRN